jgi:hypothetical protein
LYQLLYLPQLKDDEESFQLNEMVHGTERYKKGRRRESAVKWLFKLEYLPLFFYPKYLPLFQRL